MTTRFTRIGLGLLGTGALALGLAAPAGAHISPDKGEVPAGGFTSVTFTVGHGCEDSPTREVAFQIPEGILNASPQVLAGWDVVATESALDEPIPGEEGEEAQTERVSEITWTAQAGNELDPHFRQVFTIGFKAPETADGPLAFPVIQRCVEGETPWIAETVEGEEEPEHPAPFVTLGAAEEGGHGGGADDMAAEDAAEDGDEDAAGTTPVSNESDDGGSDGLAIAGLIFGLLGLGAGGTALLRSNKG
jgi:periplasmic copper chaperone A